MKCSHATGLTALIVLFFLLLPLPGLSAQSFPQPGNDEEISLLGVYYQRDSGTNPDILKGKTKIWIDGPKSLTLNPDTSEWDVLWFKVEPGLYTIVSNENIEMTPGVPDAVQIPPASVVLAPFLFERSESGVITRRLNEEIRQRAGSNLTLHVNHPLWLGHDLIGFGTLRPALDPESLQFRVSINSNPEDAEIYVDDILAGTTPIEFSLTGGKHRVLIRKEDFEDAVYYVRLEGDADIDAVLAPSAAVAMEGGSERYSTLVAPFYSMTEPNEQLARLFADTLLLTLEDDDRLKVSPSAIPWVQRDALIHPDYLPLEEIGADLMVSGFFIEIDGNLNIQANLYDIQAETIRASVTWFGTAGLDIFDAMDEIALEFAREVDRVLPAAGRTLITRHETVYSGVDRSESLIARKKIVRKRWVENPNVLTVQSGFGGVMEEFILSDGGSTSNVMRFEGPFFPVTLLWDRDISQIFAVGAGTTLAMGSYRTTDDMDQTEFTWAASVFGGPRLVFRSLRADIYLSLDVQILYSPKTTHHWQDGSSHHADLGSLLYIDFPMKVGFRYYLNKKIETIPIFLNGGLGVSPLGYRFDLGGSGQAGMMDPFILMNLGMGIRL